MTSRWSRWRWRARLWQQHHSSLCWGMEHQGEVHVKLTLSTVPLPYWWLDSRVPLISQNVPEGLHNGFLGAILCQSHPKKISDFYLHFWPLAPHIGGAVGANGKPAQKRLKKYQISKLAVDLSKSWKHLKPNAIPSFLGDVGLIKVVSKF